MNKPLHSTKKQLLRLVVPEEVKSGANREPEKGHPEHISALWITTLYCYVSIIEGLGVGNIK